MLSLEPFKFQKIFFLIALRAIHLAAVSEPGEGNKEDGRGGWVSVQRAGFPLVPGFPVRHLTDTLPESETF